MGARKSDINTALVRLVSVGVEGHVYIWRNLGVVVECLSQTLSPLST